MSISSITDIKARIAVATPKSPIAVFQLPGQQSGLLEAVFANTVMTRRRIDSSDPLLAGWFHNEMDQQFVVDRLREIVGW